MKMRNSHRGLLGGSTAAAIATGLGFLLPAIATAAPTLSLSATDAGIGQSVHATAQLAESPTATGEISFALFGPGDSACTGPALTPAPDPAPVAGEGDYDSGEITPPSAGTYYWSAHYSGDLENLPADSTCTSISTVGKASPELTGEASEGVVGTAIHDEATVNGGFSPSGEVTFSVYGPTDSDCTTPLAANSAPLEAGDAISADFLPQQAGQFRWTAAYAGDANNEPASTACGAANQSSAVSKAQPTVTGVATSAVTVGASITDSATLAGGFGPSGQLVFRAYGPDDQTCADTPEYEQAVAVNGNGAYSPAGFAPAPGLYRWTVEYEGDGNNQSASTACGAADQSSAVSKAQPTLAGVATAGAKVGLPISDSATLAGSFAAGGQLVFRAYGPDDQTCAAGPEYQQAVAISGDGAYSPPGFAPEPGVYRWTVSYAGDTNNEPASTSCGAANQSSIVSKAVPTLTGVATSAVKVGLPITDNATFAGGFEAGGQLRFRAFGPDDQACATTPVYEEAIAVDGDGAYSPVGFSPPPGLYRWTVEYAGDTNNEAASTACGVTNQSSAVGTIAVTFAVGATGGTVGGPVGATATIEGAIPAGQIAFKAFSPGDVNCSGAAAFSSVVGVAGNGSYRSPTFLSSRVGIYRWTVAYSGDVNHAPATTGCGQATSSVSPARPSISGQVKPRLTVGTPFRDTATLLGGHAPAGTITFRVYGPVAAGCAKPLFVDTVAVAGNGTVSSDPFVALRPGRYSFVASYSGDAGNQAATEPCDSVGQATLVQKRKPKVKPRARLIASRRISIRANLSGAAAPSGVVNFRLYGPDNRRCKGKPAFSGGITVKANGSYSMAEYLATEPGTYRLSVGYSGDQRNQRYKSSCGGAQTIRVG
jgi:hypothetical protein